MVPKWILLLTAAYIVAGGFAFVAICVGLYCRRKKQELEKKLEQAKQRLKQRRNSAIQKYKKQVSEKGRAVMGGLQARAETVKRIA